MRAETSDHREQGSKAAAVAGNGKRIAKCVAQEQIAAAVVVVVVVVVGG
jgi:hypothetical protein